MYADAKVENQHAYLAPVTLDTTSASMYPKNNEPIGKRSVH
jgi:hypothetical protein